MDLLAPLSGVTVSLAAVPDEVFARRLAGDGVAVDPTSSEVAAPFAGKVTQLHRAHHAVAITSPDGVEVLVHVGLDTVRLGGKHFTALVALGDEVRAGQALLRFDADAVAREARSLVTVMVLTNQPPDEQITVSAPKRVEAGVTVMLSVPHRVAHGPPATHVVPLRSAPITLPNPDGLHARPAAVLARQARQFASSVRVLRGEAGADAKSVVSLMGLATRQGDQVVLEASGPDAAEALAALTVLVREGSGEAALVKPSGPDVVQPFTPGSPSSPSSPFTASGVEGVTRLSGVAAAPGLAVGRVVQLRGAALAVAERGGLPEEERALLTTQLREAALQLEGLAREAGPSTRADLLRVQRELLEDPELLARARAGLDEGKSAAFSWQQAYAAQADQLSKLPVPLLRERAVDVRDVGERVLKLLTGLAPPAPELPNDAIVIAEEVTPSQLTSFPVSRLKGLVTVTGSPTSHVAILARGMGVPTVCGIGAAALALPDGLEVVIDGTRGELAHAPDASDLAARARLEEQITRHHAERAKERAAAFTVGQTREGHRVGVVANIRNLDDAREAMAAGAEGVGLLRSEFLFFERDTLPTEDEQAEVYRAIAQAVGKDRPLVIRTLDVGGDKPLPYLPLPKEGNPFLGVRGLRVSLDRPDLFRAQLRAILRAAELTDLYVMFPMVAGLDELRAARRLLEEERHGEKLHVGIMIEVPSAVALADLLSREVDFFSIGTNDLTQYTLAMDRGHPLLAKRADALHPAVLRMISMTAKGARDRPVHLCGGLASDPLAVPLLVGLGVTELSVSIPAVGAVKAALAKWSFGECEALAQEALTLGTTAEVRALLASRQPGGPTTTRHLRSAGGR
ncbi:MAG: phosphoenolpyruvate--protein phosphotransferase [Archangium sp.]|nr:phosphoenolpyruvate--protein phosphotransferase [Archangium sp.]